MIPDSSITGRLLRKLDTERYRHTQPGIDKNLLEKIRDVVVVYLIIPISALLGCTATIPLDFGRETFNYLRGNQTGRQALTHVVAYAILFATLPFRVVGYWVWKKDLLFPVETPLLPESQPSAVPETQHPLSKSDFDSYAALYILKKDPTLLLRLLDLPRTTGCDLGNMMVFAAAARNKELVNKLVEQGQSINAEYGDGWRKETLLEKTVKEAELLPKTVQKETLAFAAFLVEKGASLDRYGLWEIAAKYTQDIDIVRFLCTRGLRACGRRDPLGYSDFETLRDLYTRIEDSSLLLALLDQPCTFSKEEYQLREILEFAVQTRSIPLVKALLENGCKIDTYCSFGQSDYRTLLRRIFEQATTQSYSEKTRQDWIHFGKELIEYYFESNPANTPDVIFDDLTKLCVLIGDPALLLTLLNLPHPPQRSLAKIMPFAIRTKNLTLIKKLYEKKIDTFCGWDDGKYESITKRVLKRASDREQSEAARQEWLPIIDFLVSKADSCDRSELKKFAVDTRNKDLVIKLFKSGCKFYEIEPIKQLILEKRLDFALLLFDCGVEPLVRDLLNWAANLGDRDVMLFLCEQAMQPTRKRESIGFQDFNALRDLCIHLEKPNLLLGLLDLPLSPYLEKCDFDKIAEFAVRTRNRELVQKLGNKILPKFVKQVIDDACKATHSEAIRRSWREFAIFVLGKVPVNQAELIELMNVARLAKDLEVGRILYRLDENGLLDKAMRDAVNDYRYEPLRFLLELQVNLNIHLPGGHTPLTMAVSRKSLRIVQMLLADPRLNRNLPCEYLLCYGKTALQVAVQLGFDEIASLLQPGWKRKPKPSEYEPPKNFVPPEVPKVLKIPYFPRDLFPANLCRRASEVKPEKEQTTPFEKSRLAEFLSQIALGSKTPPYWGIFGVREDEAVTMGSEAFNTRTKNLIVNIHHDQNRALEGEDKVFCEQVYQAVFEVRRKLLGALKELEK